MEALLQYVWKHKLFPWNGLKTTDGLDVEVIDTGLQNANAGPDFFNAKVKVGGTMWVGNVEIHERSSAWHVHGHDRDKAYDNVVLHVAEQIDADVTACDGRRIAQVKLEVPQDVKNNYEALLSADRYPPCYAVTKTLDKLTVHSWMSRLLTERLERKTEAINSRVGLCGGSWESALFVTTARNYGFGVNGDMFERWALSFPPQCAAHHRDDIFQIEALFMGQAGLLDQPHGRRRQNAGGEGDDYYNRLKGEYAYLAHKFGLKPIDGSAWKFLRMRPQNFPYIRLSQLATLYHSRRADLSRIAECTTAEQMRETLDTHVTPYWETHYTFGKESKRARKGLSAASLDLIIINTAVPMLFAYGRHRGDEAMCGRAIDIMSQLKAEDNNIVRLWRECGISADNAGDSQALIQLKREYCDKKDCLRCRIGFEYLKRGKP